MNHVDKSERCPSLYIMCREPLGSECIMEAELKDKVHMDNLHKSGWKRHKAVQAASRMSGPLLHVAEMAGISHAIGLRGAWMRD